MKKSLITICLSAFYLIACGDDSHSHSHGDGHDHDHDSHEHHNHDEHEHVHDQDHHENEQEDFVIESHGKTDDDHKHSAPSY